MSYHCVMNTNNPVSEAPGAAEAIDGVTTVEVIESYLKRDLSVAISCLNAIQSDPDLMHSMAHFMRGRFINAQHAKEVAKGPN